MKNPAWRECDFSGYDAVFHVAADIITKWTFRLDADERLTPELIRELEELTRLHDNDDVNGIAMEAWLYFFGRRIRHGCRNKRKLMLFKAGIGRIAYQFIFVMQ